MKHFFLVSLTFLIVSLNTYSQNNIKIELTESYELGNIILALTDYGRTDKWDVQKISPCYDDIIKYFKPVKNHPLLDSVNYSRKKWEKFLGFRTDMYAFSFDKNGNLKRDFPFSSFRNNEVEKNIELINDFVKKSKYREFYKKNKIFYESLIANYKDFYLINEMKAFLDKIIDNPVNIKEEKYVVAISPLVGGQNCHRNIDSLTTVDFPNISKDLILANLNDNLKTRLVESHTIFTEKDHGYINPISEKFRELIDKNFDYNKWDSKSGYSSINVFNEYLTWAVYDLFVKEKFPEFADSISLQWHYQNISRGFIAQNLFSEKLLALYSKSKDKKIENLYEPLLKWCKNVEDIIKQPTLLNVDTKSFVTVDLNNFKIDFSEKMNINKTFKILIYELKNGNQTGNSEVYEVNNNKWTNEENSVTIKIETKFNEFVVLFNWWGIDKPLYSKQGIMLKPESYILIKK